jgi:hypothetical protein
VGTPVYVLAFACRYVGLGIVKAPCFMLVNRK